ncbi:MAG: RNA polymerase sigma factor [Gemmataceae bacterium]
MLETSASLLVRLQTPDDSEAWKRFIELYTPLLWAWTRQQAIPPDDAADLIQEVFALLLRKLPVFQYDGRKRFRGWLKTVTLNKYRELKRRPVLQTVGGTDSEAAYLEPAIEDDPFWEIDYQRHLSRQALRIMQSEFSETTWKACWSTVVDGRPTEEVAIELGMTPGAVRSARMRVLIRLRQELAGLVD